jgi:DNA-binding beta-propeller fold protein YncE
MKYISILLLVFAASGTLLGPADAYKTVEFISEFGGKGEALGKFSDKTRFTFDKDSNIYVVDTENLCIQKLSPDGKPVMEIVDGDEFLFNRPMDIAVDGDLNIYVTDWNSVHIQNTDSPRIFNYGPCVHKFSRDGKFVATFTLEDLSQKAVGKESAVPAVDTDGSFALMILPEKRDRQLYLAADTAGNIYILDQDTIYKLSSSGEILAHFAEPGGGPGQLDNVTDIAVDTKGNVYVADTGNHRISKFSSDGKFLLSFGGRGDTDGRLTGELRVTAASDGTVLVADSAQYRKILKTSFEHRKLIDSTILVTGQDDPLIPRRRSFETVIRRLQRFGENGEFQEKILYRIDRSDPELRDMEFKAVDPDGNLYLVDEDRLTIRKYSVKPPVEWSEVEKTLSCQLEHVKSRSRIDNFYDLNSYIDFDEREQYTLVNATMTLSYDMTETFRVSLASSALGLTARTYNDYPGEYADPSGFIQDDETIDKYIALRTRLDLSLILDHDPFKYRVGRLFAYFGGGRYDFDIKATDFSNRRELDEHLWWNVWAVGARYDIGSSMRLSLIAAQHRPPGFMNYEYRYWDENGELYGTGFGSGASTEVFIAIDGAF